DEASHAARVADHLGTDHTEMEVRPAEAGEVIPKLPEMFGEPFADPTQIPNFLVAKIARSDVTVALSGDGGDELYGGYNRHLWGPRVWAALRAVPALVRRGASRAGRAISRARWNSLSGAADRVVPGGIGLRGPGQKVHKLADVLPARDPGELYERLDTQWFDPTDVVRGLTRCPAPVRRAFSEIDGPFAERMMYADLVGYLPDQILTKVDRTSMAVSLESRVPMLDHRLVEFAWRLPLRMKIRDGTGKWLLRRVLYRHVPREIVDRPKTGFGFPVADWLRGPLRDWAEELLDERRLRDQGYLRPTPIREAWQRHLAGDAELGHDLWAVLMFESWLEYRSL
ncbi:MAG: asparagine synthetase B, partial [Bradymonadaceae bacterium]